jgi:hypothetical protein
MRASRLMLRAAAAIRKQPMIRKLAFIAAIGAGLLPALACAQHRNLDLHDYDDDLMRDLDKSLKYFEPDIIAGNAQGALDDAAVLDEGFKYTLGYFLKKGDADDAVQISKEGQSYVAAAIKSVSENNFEAAADAARGASKACRACHEIYKPLKK